MSDEYIYPIGMSSLDVEACEICFDQHHGDYIYDHYDIEHKEAVRVCESCKNKLYAGEAAQDAHQHS